MSRFGLSFTCPKKLSDLDKESKETYSCSTCQKKVYDLRKKSSKEVKVLQQNNDSICGILSTNIQPTWIRKSTLVFGFTLLGWNAWGQNETELDSLKPEPEKPIIEDNIVIGSVVETMPEPVGGNEAFYRAIASVLTFPDSLYNREFPPSKIYISFVVDTSGNLIDHKILRGYSQALDQHIIEQFKSLNYKFTPGFQSGKKVKTRFTLPIRICLD